MGTTRGRRVVLLLANNPYPFDARVHPHAEGLRDAGYQVTVISRGRQGLPVRERLAGVEVYRFPLRDGDGLVGYIIEFVAAALLCTALTLWVWLRHGMDVLHIYAPPDTLFLAGLLPRLARKPVLYDLRDLGPELYQSQVDRPNPVIVWGLRLMEYCSCAVATQVIAVNDSYRRLVIARDRVDPNRVTVVRQGPDADKLRPADPDPALRGRARTIIGYLGLMARQDGVDHLFMALHYLDHELGYRDWHCVLIGNATDRAGLDRLARELGIDDRIEFTGYLTGAALVRHLAAIDLGVVPDPAYPLNKLSTMNKLMDYMAMAKPSVGYDLHEHRVTAGDAALYARPDNPLELARQMLRLIEDPGLREQLGAIGRQRIEQQLALSFQRERLLRIYAGTARPQSGAAKEARQP